ncbi:MAG: GerMN domain-containing protein, partial [Candidatus Eisenbacteria bacterium]|nr:GerMN domain-containing protein [Candidatus Eisenbacteria bacterium]
MSHKRYLIPAVLLALLLGLAVGYFWSRPRGPRGALPPRTASPDTAVTGTLVQVFFARIDDETGEPVLVGVPRRLPLGARPLPGSILGLLEGPTKEEWQSGLRSEIPPATSLLGVREEDGIAWLNFNDRVETGGGTLSMQTRLRQILRTATQFPDVKGVEIMINGKVPEAFGGEGILLDHPMRPEAPPVGAGGWDARGAGGADGASDAGGAPPDS